jgi:hypothetical protein
MMLGWRSWTIADGHIGAKFNAPTIVAALRLASGRTRRSRIRARYPAPRSTATAGRRWLAMIDDDSPQHPINLGLLPWPHLLFRCGFKTAIAGIGCEEVGVDELRSQHAAIRAGKSCAELGGGC